MYRVKDYLTRDAWLASRSERGRYFIGASEVAAALGVSPYTSPFDLWAKHHAPELLPIESGSHLAGGTRWEEVAGRLFEMDMLAMGLECERPQWAVAWRDDVPWVRATPDAWVRSGGELVDLWECKTIRYERVAHEVAGDVGFEAVDPSPSAWPEEGAVIADYGDDVNGPVPIWMWLQCQAQMFATGAPRVTLEAWFFGFDAPTCRRLVVLFDEERWAAVLARVAAWRNAHLVGGEPPTPRNPADALLLARWRWPVKALSRQATDEEARLIVEICRWRNEQKGAEARVDAARAELAGLMGSTAKVWSPYGTASFNKKGALSVKE